MKQSVPDVGRGLEDMNIVAAVDRCHGHLLEWVQVHLVYLLEMAGMHKLLFALTQVPKTHVVLAHAPNHVPLLVAPL